MILEEMYRGGLRTPNAAQIQQITAHLSGYGRIEGKNLLSPTSATTPAAAAAYTTGFYYPFAATAPPARTSPASPLFQYNQGGMVLPAAEAIGRSEYSLGKLVDNFGVALEEAFPEQQPATTAVVDTPPAAAGFCRPLKTLDLFPGGLKEEQHDVV
ncbi:hypothetical protein E2562_008389 [Oryza meyeriana var. granulata]|uniref:Homeobox domain-containing protein n=1 Tax=Oryza meyeriana var. granulata TaxID=110450 RepID=A0A6G1EH99_9ORYZ|nr:hypothetical protein E2562_008389 [Oryza meyeriana var. granulata]